MKCIKVRLNEAENVRIRLLKLDVFDKNYRAIRDEDYVYFPVTKVIRGYDIIDKKLRMNSKSNFEEELRSRLNSKELIFLNKSFDTIGGIAIIEIHKKLLKKKKIIANSLLKLNKNIKTVLMKRGGHEGKFRLQQYEFLAGDKKFETLHKENGIVLKLDVRKTYFSPRLASERLRVAKSVKENENILVMFSGISPYEINISRHSRANEIYGVEMNKDACKYAAENVKLNHARNVKLFCGDVRKVVPKLKKKFDRIVMPLPLSSKDFLDVALKVIKKKGVVHFYCFSKEDEIKNVVDFIKSKAKIKVLNIVKCGQQSPYVFRYCIDFRVLR